MRWNPHFHCIVLEGGIDETGSFYHIPIKDTAQLVEVFRRRVIKLFVDRGLLDRRFASKILSWQHSGFSVDNSVAIHASSRKARVNLSQGTTDCIPAGQREKANKDGSLTKYGYAPAPQKLPEHTSDPETETVSNKASRRSWARLVQKVYEVDPLICPQCGHEMKVLVVITDPHEVQKILECLKRNKAPPFEKVALKVS